MTITTKETLIGIKILNAIDLFGIALILLVAIVLQVALNELPCPLCLLQRLGLIAMGFGFLLNIYYYVRPSHYALSLLASVFTGMVAFRQMLLHIAPGDPGYGSAIFGLHMYTWVFIMSVIAIIYISIVMSWPRQYLPSIGHQDDLYKMKNPWMKRFCHLAFALFFIAALENVVSTFYECGFHECPDNPTTYVFGAHLFHALFPNSQ